MINTALGSIDFTYSVNGDDQLSEMYEVRLDGDYIGVIDYYDIQEIMDEQGVSLANDMSPEAAQEIVEDYFF